MPRVTTTGRPSRARLMRGLLAAAALFAIVAAGSWFLRPRSDPRRGSVAVSGGTVRVGDRVPRSYRIVYRVEDAASAGEASRSELVVHRPFASRSEKITSAFGRTSFGAASVFAPPGPPSGDLRPDVLLADALRDGYADKRELRRVARRLCRVYRIGGSADAVSLPPVATGAEPTDVCVDEAGLVLEEVTFRKTSGDVVRRRVATSVSERPPVTDETFEVSKPEGDPRQIGSVQELEPDSRLPGGTFWELPKGPKGFELRGRYAVVPAGQPGFNDPASRSSVISFVSEVWTDGPDVLLIDQGATQGAAPFADDPDAIDVKIGDVKAGDLGKGELLYSMAASEVRFITGGARFVRVRGTLPPSKLLAIAKTLDGRPGGPLRLKDDPA